MYESELEGGSHAPVIRRKFPSSSALANARNKITVRYAGMNKSEPRRNMARWENRPLGGLIIEWVKSITGQSCNKCVRRTRYYCKSSMIKTVLDINMTQERTDRDKIDKRSVQGTSRQLMVQTVRDGCGQSTKCVKLTELREMTSVQIQASWLIFPAETKLY